MKTPLSDNDRDLLFEKISEGVQGKSCIHLFANDGGLGNEALARGAKSCIFIDIDKAKTDAISLKLAAKGLLTKADVRTTDAFLYLKGTSKVFDIIFATPPRGSSEWLETMKVIAERSDLLSITGIVVLVVDRRMYELFSTTTLQEKFSLSTKNNLLLAYQRSNIVPL